MDLAAIDAEIAEFELEYGDLSALDSSDLSLADVDQLLEEYEAAVHVQERGGTESDTTMVS